jgi:hypothetical protein
MKKVSLVLAMIFFTTLSYATMTPAPKEIYHVLRPLYKAAVIAYKQEHYGLAMDLFDHILLVNVTYKDALRYKRLCQERLNLSAQHSGAAEAPAGENSPLPPR